MKKSPSAMMRRSHAQANSAPRPRAEPLSAATTAPDQGSAVTPPPPVKEGSAVAPPPEHAGSAEVKDVIKLSAVTIDSNPPGAEILINGASIGKQTPATLNLPVGKSVSVRLKLSSYADYRKEIDIKGESLKLDVPLRKVRTTHRTGGTKEKDPGAGKTGGRERCDTCLERPD